MTVSKHIHLIGICGTAMASLAGMLAERGFRVTGSDSAAYPPMSGFLHSLGIPVAQPFAAENLSPQPALVVVGNAISRGNVELEHVLDQRIPFCSLPQLLHDEFLRGKEVLVVAGTHGKTTTTSMLSWIFEFAGLEPSFLIGGIAENFGRSFQLKPGKHFIIEGDEYDSAFFDKGPKFLHYFPDAAILTSVEFDHADICSFQLKPGKHFIIEGDEYDSAFFDKGPKFLHYFPDAAILTSVEFDHADIYKDLDAVETAFKRLVNLLPGRGRIIAFDSGESVEKCIAGAFCPIERYGVTSQATWRIIDLRLETDVTLWSVVRNGSFWVELKFALAGEYNVWNATAAAALAANYGIPSATIAGALKSFKSVKRRLEVKAEVNGITIVDDFAHHPTAIAATLNALRARYPGRRLWAILEPRSNTLRRNVFQDELAESLSLADEVVIANVFKSQSIPENERLDVGAVATQLSTSGHRARVLADVDSIVKICSPEMLSGDVVAILSNGGFGGIYEKLPQRLKMQSADAVQASTSR